METKELDNDYVAHAYGRFNVTLNNGKGSTISDDNGKQYIDFGSGIGVTAFGICDDEWKALKCNLTRCSTSAIFTTQSLVQGLQKCFATKQV